MTDSITKRILVAALTLLLCGGIRAQEPDPAYYAFPIDAPPLFSANFGEMRPDHFHSGVDIKTGGVEGKTVRAAADGYVSRIGVHGGGYGRVLYIAHPNGTTTVYGHMQRFTPEIEAWVRSERYRLRRNEVDLYPAPERFPVRRGEPIGRSGNSGSSFGPHLHFEVRQSASQRTLNTVSAGILTPADDIPPYIVRLHYVEVDTVAGIPVHAEPCSRAVRSLGGGRYALADTAALAVGSNGYFVVEVTDRKNGVHNTFGVRRVAAKMDGRPIFEYRMDGFLFSQTRYCNAVACYPLQRSSRNEAMRLARLEGNRFPYPVLEDEGVIRTACGERRRVEIEAEDDCGNRSHLAFAVVGKADEACFRGEVPEGGIALDCSAPFRHAAEGVSVEIPADALYESIFYTQRRDDELSALAARDTTVMVLSPVVAVHDEQVPLHEAITLRIEGYVPESLRARTTIASVSESGRVSRAGGRWSRGGVETRTRRFGNYCLAADTVPPRIEALFAAGADLSRASGLTFRLRDNSAGIASYSGTVDGKWVIFERNVMKGTVTHRFDDQCYGRGKRHTVTLTVRDGVGNVATWRGEFFR